jgi:hypothetical protein
MGLILLDSEGVGAAVVVMAFFALLLVAWLIDIITGAIWKRVRPRFKSKS